MATSITILIAVVMLIGVYVIMRFVVKYRKKKLKIKRHLLGDFELQRYLSRPDHHPEVLPFQQRNVMNHSVINIRSFRNDTVPPLDYRKDKYVRCSGCVLSLLSAVIVAISVFVILLFPNVPEYYICDTETDWNRIWSAMQHLSAQSTFDILFSVKNNNYFSTELSNIGLRIYYGNPGEDSKELIGHYYSNEENGNESRIYIPHHSITDVLLPITMDPSVFEAYSLWKLYKNDSLPLELDFYADTSTYFLGKHRDWKLLDLHVNMQLKDYMVGANLVTDRTGCNCPAKPL